METKQDLILDILSAINKHSKDSDDSCCLFIMGDAKAEKAFVTTQGNGIVLAEAFGNQMRTNENFNRLMTSLFGSYLSQHPQEKDAFIRGLELTTGLPTEN